LYTELVAKVVTRLGVAQNQIVSIGFEGADVSIEDDGDVLQLQDGETVEITTTKDDEEDDDDEEVPDLE
jgi:hypothetical protein